MCFHLFKRKQLILLLQEELLSLDGGELSEGNSHNLVPGFHCDK